MSSTFVVQTSKVASQNAPSIISSISKGFNNLLKNAGVKLGIGVGGAGIGTAVGLGAINETAKEVTNPLGIPSGYLVIGIIILLVLVVLKR